MAKIIVDDEKCTACRTCEVACSLEHANALNPKHSKIRVYVEGDRFLPVIAGSFHEGKVPDEYASVVEDGAGECNFCLACVEWCVSGALTLERGSSQGESR